VVDYDAVNAGAGRYGLVGRWWGCLGWELSGALGFRCVGQSGIGNRVRMDLLGVGMGRKPQDEQESKVSSRHQLRSPRIFIVIRITGAKSRCSVRRTR
jgi:hypothetical protein